MCKLWQYFVCDCVQTHFYISRWRGSQGSLAGLLLTVVTCVLLGCLRWSCCCFSQFKGLLLLKGKMALLYLSFLLLCCLDTALPADCCAHLFPDPKEDSQLFSTGCIFCWTHRGVLQARACTNKWQQHMSGRGSKTSPFLAVVSC